jgi:hypothetical protein
MPWILKGLLLAMKSRRGRELLFAGALGAYELARSERAQKVYAKARAAAHDPRPREIAKSTLRKAAERVKR